MEAKLHDYYQMVSRNEDLKSEERILNAMLGNFKELRDLIIEKEKSFCDEDKLLRQSTSGSVDSLKSRCVKMIDHFVHYKCIVECLATDILNMESKMLNDDEYISLSLTYRQVELIILQAIKTNQQRNEVLSKMTDDNITAEIEGKWCLELSEIRKLMDRLFQNHNSFLFNKTKRNLDQQQVLLNERCQFITTLIRP